MIEMYKEKSVTILLKKNQIEKLKVESEKTENSQNSIIRTALDNFFRIRPEEMT